MNDADDTQYLGTPLMKLAIQCDTCGRMYGNPALTHIDQAPALRAEARAAGWSGDMMRLSVKDACPECRPPAPPPAQPGALPQALRTAALPVDNPFGGKGPDDHYEPKPTPNETGFDGHKESKS